MDCKDIGREQAASKPLLRMVFQAMVRMKLCGPRRRILMFVIRDKTKTPLEKLEASLRKNIQEIWDSALEPQDHKKSILNDFFNVEVVALSNYEYMQDEFKKQVMQIRKRLINSIAPGGIASGFSLYAQEIWKKIKENKDLDLPSHKVMVATVRCEKIADEKYSCFEANETWCHLKVSVQSGQVSGFGKKINLLLKASLSRYDEETKGFQEDIRTAKHNELKQKLLHLVQPSFKTLLEQIRLLTLEEFKEALDEGLEKNKKFYEAAHLCAMSFLEKFDEKSADAAVKSANWDTSKVKDELKCSINAHVAAKRILFLEGERTALVKKEQTAILKRAALIIQKNLIEKKQAALETKNERIEKERNNLKIEKGQLLKERRDREERERINKERIKKQEEKMAATKTTFKVLKGASTVYRCLTLDFGLIVDVCEAVFDNAADVASAVIDTGSTSEYVIGESDASTVTIETVADQLAAALSSSDHDLAAVLLKTVADNLIAAALSSGPGGEAGVRLANAAIELAAAAAAFTQASGPRPSVL